MKIKLPCMICIQESKGEKYTYIKVDMNNEGVYNCTCEYGHNLCIVFQKTKFEILFDTGAYAIIDGYYREAVSCFSASLERFYEFYFKVISSARNIEEAEIDESWKKLAKQSERQLGAYVISYLLENKKSSPILSNDLRNFRNKVIHKGMYPSKMKAIEFGQAIYDLIYPVLEDLKSKYPDQVVEMSTKVLFSLPDDMGFPRNTYWFETILSVLPGGKPERKELSDEIKNMASGIGGWAYRNVEDR